MIITLMMMMMYTEGEGDDKDLCVRVYFPVCGVKKAEAEEG